MNAWRFGGIAAIVAGVWLTGLPAPAALSGDNTDLREFRIGMRVDELPRSGYVEFTCAAAPSTELDGWKDYARCPPDQSGFHVVRFEYDEAANPMAKINDDHEGTKIGGHPVIMSLIISGDGRLQGIRIQTDPKARLYLKKKAFLFGRQAMERYGEGWSCIKHPPGPGEEPVGGMLIKEHCEKTTATRRYVLDRELFRRAGEPLRNFVTNTQLTISERQ